MNSLTEYAIWATAIIVAIVLVAFLDGLLVAYIEYRIRKFSGEELNTSPEQSQQSENTQTD